MDKLVELRINLGLSQKGLADAAGLSNTTVWQLEQGNAVRPASLKKIADVLGVQPVDLLKKDA